MKKIFIQLFIVAVGIYLSIISIISIRKYFYMNNFNQSNEKLIYNDLTKQNSSFNEINYTTEESKIENIQEEPLEEKITTIALSETNITEIEENIVTEETKEIIDDGTIIYDNLTLTELINKLNKNLNSTLTNTGIYFAKYYQNTGLDPYLAVAIVLHETGCYWNCSKLVTENYNIGGLRGVNGYMKFNTLEEGINGFLDILYNNYYSKGLTTPELINPKYASSTTWSEKINNYIEKIKAS